MAKKPVALIIAGSEPVTDTEVEDLLLDRWPDDEYILDLVVPVNKDLFTKAVETVVDWYNDDALVYTVREKDGANLSRRSAKLGEEGSTQEVDTFAEIFNPKDFKDWDEVHLLIAMPENPEDAEYEVYAALVEAAIEAEFSVLNLARGLDDVRLEDEPEPDPEPEPKAEEKPPARRSRKKAEPKAEEPEESETTKKVKELQKATGPLDSRLDEVLDALQDAARYLRGTDEALQVYQQLDEPDYRPLTSKVSKALETLKDYVSDPVGDAEPAKAAEEPEETSSRGRGRPRTNFIENEVYDEDRDEWGPRPKGRLAKGTKWRKYNTKTDEVVEEGTT